jgi:hypothetical protein
MRILALGLTALWAATALAVAAAYRPGGPLDILVIAICFAPITVSLAAVRWPAEARGPRDRVALVWLWIGAMLLGIPVLYGVGSSLTAASQSLAPSVEAAYSAGLALLAMAIWSVLGFAHERVGVPVFQRQASLAAGGLAVVLTAAVAALFGLVVLINEAALLDDGQARSRFGPVGAHLVPPDCDAPLLLGPNAQVSVSARSILDDDPRGSAEVTGLRRGRDEAWSGTWAGPDGEGRTSYLRLGEQAWRRDTAAAGGSADERTWRAVPPDPFGLGGDTALTLDGPPHAVVAVPRGQIVAEDLGLEVVEGATARHCRTFMDGPTALDTFLPLRWLLHDSDAPADEQVARWRGEMDWWVFADGELGRARVEVSGSRADTTWDATGVRAVLEAELDAMERDRVPDIAAPALLSPAVSTSPSAAASSSASSSSSALGFPAPSAQTSAPGSPSPSAALESAAP